MEKYNQFKALYDEIDILISNHVTSSNTEFIKWHKKVERFLKLYYNEGDEYNDFVKTSFTLSLCTFSTPDSAWVEACADALRKTKAIFEVYLEELQREDGEDTLANNENKIEPVNNKVFVVHGHDGELKMRLLEHLKDKALNQ